MRRMLRAQGGMASVATVMLLLLILLASVTTAVLLSASDASDSALQSDGVEALFLAESGVERAAKLFQATSLCTNAALQVGTSIPFGRGSFATVAALSTDFSGVALGSKRCRVQVTGSIGSVSRTIDAIVGQQNLLAQANTNFNAPPPPAPGPPTGWTVTQSGATSGNWWDDAGGPDGSRSIYLLKPGTGSGVGNNAGQYGLTPFTVVAPTNLTIAFDYKVDAGSSPQEIDLSFSISDGTNTYSSPVHKAGNTGASFASAVLTIAVTGAGLRTFTTLGFSLTLKAGPSNKQAWLDNLVLGWSGAGNGVMVQSWREIPKP